MDPLVLVGASLIDGTGAPPVRGRAVVAGQPGERIGALADVRLVLARGAVVEAP